MAHIDPLLDRNKHFATTSACEGTSMAAKHVLMCDGPADAREVAASTTPAAWPGWPDGRGPGRCRWWSTR
jgi:hypothetical protein